MGYKYVILVGIDSEGEAGLTQDWQRVEEGKVGRSGGMGGSWFGQGCRKIGTAGSRCGLEKVMMDGGTVN